MVDGKKEGKAEFSLHLLLSVPERCCSSAREQGEHNSPASSYFASSDFSLLLTPNIPYKTRFSLLHYQCCVQMHIFRSFLPVLSLFSGQGFVAGQGFPVAVKSACSLCLHMPMKINYKFLVNLRYSGCHWYTLFSSSAFEVYSITPIYLCSLSSLTAVSLDSLKLLLCTPNLSTRAFLVQGAPLTFLFLRKSIGIDIYRQIYEHCIVWISWFMSSQF